MPALVLLNLAVVGAALLLLARRQRAGGTLGSTVLLAMVAGALLGAGAQAAYGLDSPVLTRTLDWVGIVGTGYVRLLQMIVTPLVLLSILGAVTKLGSLRSLGAISVGVIGLLLALTAASAFIGVEIAQLFALEVEGLAQGARELAKAAALEAKVGEAKGLTIPALLVSFVPVNVFADLAGTRATSIMGVVIVAALTGVAVLQLAAERPELGARLLGGIDTLQQLVMRVVRIVIRLTPYGVLALMARMAATSSLADIVTLGRFVVASYVGLAVILLLHAAVLLAAGLSPLRFYQRAWPVLSFAFSSRSSAAAIPLSVETQVGRLGVAPAVANFAASFGATLGQNACAGLYPAMLAVMIAPSAGVDPTTPAFIGSVVTAAALGSIGIAGVGGGATFAAIVVLSALDLPVALAGLLISVEPLIDMGRTAVNVSGAMTAGAVTSRWLGLTDRAVFTADPVPAPPAAERGTAGPLAT